MPALTDAIDSRAQLARGRMFWVLLGALAAGQLFAFWLLCSHQVRKAQARDNALLVQQMAVADCLQYMPRATIASCAHPGEPEVQPAQHLQPAAGVAGAMPVSFSLR
ncbi:MAG TPA: hypothetical protein VFE74_01625 [Ramlibacter sp.]|nr:hypothetical protein [Ramlibacter sp.]